MPKGLFPDVPGDALHPLSTEFQPLTGNANAQRLSIFCGFGPVAFWKRRKKVCTSIPAVLASAATLISSPLWASGPTTGITTCTGPALLSGAPPSTPNSAEPQVSDRQIEDATAAQAERLTAKVLLTSFRRNATRGQLQRSPPAGLQGLT